MKSSTNVNVKQNRRTAAVITVITFLFLLPLFLSFLMEDTFRLANHQVNDLFFRLRFLIKGTGRVCPEFYFFNITDSFDNQYPASHTDRTIYASALEKLHTAGIKTVLWDIFFSDELTTGGDLKFAEVTAESGNVYYPFYFNRQRAQYESETVSSLLKKYLFIPASIKGKGNPGHTDLNTIHYPFTALARAAAGLGFSNADLDNDSIERRYSLFFQSDQGYLPSLVLASICHFLQVDLSRIEIHYGEYIKLPGALHYGIKKDFIIPIDKKGRMLINFTGPVQKSLPHYPLEKVLANLETGESDLPGLLQNTFVFIGDLSTRGKDWSRGIFDAVYPDSFVLGSAINTILTEDYLTDSYPVSNSILFTFVLSLMFLFWFTCSKRSTRSFLLFFFLFLSLIILITIGIYFFLRGIQLNAANSILIRNFMKFPGVFSESVLPALIVLLMFFLSTRLKLFPLLVSCLGIYLLFWLINFSFFLLFSQLTGLITPSIGFLFSGVFIFCYRFIIEERKRITLQAAKENERFQKEFIQDIAHELKTPLTLVLGPLEILLKNPYTDVEEKINFISRNTQKLLYLINQFLQLSKLETSDIKLSFQPVEIIHWLHRKLMNFGYLSNDKKIKSNFNPLNRKQLIVYADINKLDMIFNNIFMNVYKYAGENSRVDVEVSDPAPLAGELRNKEWQHNIPDEMVIIKIKDTGIGIPREEIRRIFERKMEGQYSGSGVHSGTGIGLYIVMKYIEFHYGSIEVKSEPGKGTEFIITLPLGNSHLEKSRIIEGSHTKKSFEEDKNPGEVLNINSSEREMNLSGKKKKQFRRKKREGSSGTILVVEDEPDMRFYIKEVLEDYYEIVEAVNGNDGYEKAQKIKPDLILSDIRMPELDGIQLLIKIKQDTKLAHIPIIFITVNELADLDFNQEIQEPDEYLTKPFSPGILLSRVKNILELKNHKKELDDIEKSLNLKNPGVFSKIITNNIKMKMLFKQIEEMAPLSQPILITGETGVGKELIAEAIHNASGLKGAYIPTNIAAYEKGLLSSGLFGHKKGAFTGADKDNEGLIKAAGGGTLFLDEIGDMDYEAQIKLLRALDPGNYEMVGSTQSLKCEARIIAASNRHLQHLINEDKFRHDLLNRFIYKIHIPPLRERRGDLILLLNHFFQLAAKESGKPLPQGDFGELIQMLRTYSFPNNIRDLKNMVYSAVSSIDYKGRLPLAVFQNYMREYPGNTDKQEIIHPGSAKTITFSGGFYTLDEVVEIYIRAVLKKTNQNVEKAAEILGKDKSVIYKKLKRYVST